MKHSKTAIAAFFLAITLGGCTDRKQAAKVPMMQEVENGEADSTVYGVCSEGTSMHSLQLLTDLGDTLEFALVDDDDNATDVQGGLMCGDRLAIMARKGKDASIATKVINLTTLLGRWNSIDKDFVIEEGGVVKSNVKAEKNTWVSWKIFNGCMLLNKDTFCINSLGADSLYLENDKGIYVFVRKKQVNTDAAQEQD